MTPALRTKILGALAAGAVLYAVIDAVQAPGASATSTAADDVAATTSAVVVLAGAPRDLDRKALAERYRPIRSAEPFKPRSFDPPRPPRPVRPEGPRPDRPNGPRPVAPSPPPDKIDVRLTGFLGRGEARRAVLEETNSSGKALVVAAGLSLGPVSVAAVGTDSITFTLEGAQTRSVELGSSIELPKAVESKLEQLKVTSGDVAAVTTGGSAGSSSSGSAAAPPVSDEERKAVLERLRERRRRSIQGGGE